MLSFKEIKDLIDLVAERGLSALEVEQTGFRIRIEGAHSASGNGAAALPGPPALAAPAPAGTAPVPAAEAEAESLHVITSPIVGTFYRSPSPESDPFAQVGQKVAKGKILCIIESMKLMNEIEAETAGVIESKLVMNGQPVEYGEALFAIRAV